MSKRAILVVDIQNEYFPYGALPLVGIEDAVANAAKVIASAREGGDLVVNIRHEAPGASIFVPGSKGVEIHSSVAPAEDEPVIVKNFPNSFRNTNLRDILDANGVTDVVVIGAMSHMCVDATTRAANDFGYATTTVHDACATRDLEFGGVTAPAAEVHTSIMAALAFAYGTVISTEEFTA